MHISGIAVLAKIKGNPHLKRSPVVVLTTTDERREMQNCCDLGACISLGIVVPNGSQMPSNTLIRPRRGKVRVRVNAFSIALTLGNLAKYEADMEDPGGVYEDLARCAQCLKMYGNICFDTRDCYVNFPWSSEGK